MMVLFRVLIPVLHKFITFAHISTLAYSSRSVFFESTVLTEVEIFEKKQSHKPQWCQTIRRTHVDFICSLGKVLMSKLVPWFGRFLCKVANASVLPQQI